MSEPRYCSNCCQRKPVAGGKDKILNNGRNRRWVCADCAAKKSGSWFGKVAK